MTARRPPLERRAASTTEEEALCFWLGDKRHFGFVQAHGGRGFHVRDGRRQNLVGFPDVLMLLPRRGGMPDLTVAMEIKVDGDVLSPDQRDVLGRFARAGALAMVCRYGRLREGEVDQAEAVAAITAALGEGTR